MSKAQCNHGQITRPPPALVTRIMRAERRWRRKHYTLFWSVKKRWHNNFINLQEMTNTIINLKGLCNTSDKRFHYFLDVWKHWAALRDLVVAADPPSVPALLLWLFLSGYRMRFLLQLEESRPKDAKPLYWRNASARQTPRAGKRKTCRASFQVIWGA